MNWGSWNTNMNISTQINTNTNTNTKTRVNLEEPKGYEGDKVESNGKLLPRERTQSVVFAVKEPGDICWFLGGRERGEERGGRKRGGGDGRGEGGKRGGRGGNEPPKFPPWEALLLLGCAPEDDGEEEEGEGQVHLKTFCFRVFQFCQDVWSSCIHISLFVRLVCKEITDDLCEWGISTKTHHNRGHCISHPGCVGEGVLVAANIYNGVLILSLS